MRIKHSNKSIFLDRDGTLIKAIKKDFIICPTDYPYLYTEADKTRIFLGENKHWRQIDQSLCTFLTSKKIVEKYWEDFRCSF